MTNFWAITRTDWRDAKWHLLMFTVIWGRLKPSRPTTLWPSLTRYTQSSQVVKSPKRPCWKSPLSSLLQREPNTSILAKFKLEVISQYFSDYAKQAWTWLDLTKSLRGYVVQLSHQHQAQHRPFCDRNPDLHFTDCVSLHLVQEAQTQKDQRVYSAAQLADRSAAILITKRNNSPLPNGSLNNDQYWLLKCPKKNYVKFGFLYYNDTLRRVATPSLRAVKYFRLPFAPEGSLLFVQWEP